MVVAVVKIADFRSFTLHTLQDEKLDGAARFGRLALNETSTSSKNNADGRAAALPLEHGSRPYGALRSYGDHYYGANVSHSKRDATTLCAAYTVRAWAFTAFASTACHA